MANMNFGVNILPKANNTYTLGNSDYKWNIFANTLNGISLTNIITDIQIDGTSIISNNIATLPVASANDYGVIKIGTGLYTNSSGVLYVNSATSTQIKSETSNYVPIVPKNQHEAVFYGLAKAAGDSTQAASSNAVGNYTDDAKAAIRSMLGVTVTDVQINSTSILSNGIANIPLATSDTFGVMKSGNGLYYADGVININPASAAEIKAGESWTKPIVPNFLPNAVFYGLARAASDSTQGASSNTVGTYTDTAKAAIQSMLSVAPTANPIFTGSFSHNRKASTTIGTNSFTAGDNCEASAEEAHAVGRYTTASGAYSHAEGNYTTASGMAAHAEGTVTVANHADQHVFGEYNVADASVANAWSRGNYIEIVGNGTADNAKSNARVLDWSGNEYLKGDVYVGCNADSSGGTKLIKDIKINNTTSIVSNGVANIPIATDSNLGVVSNGGMGIGINSSGHLYLNYATDSIIKTGTSIYNAITVGYQHEAVFYGLAKAAGDSTQSASSNSIGNYTDDAKAAISTMLGVPQVDDLYVYAPKASYASAESWRLNESDGLCSFNSSYKLIKYEVKAGQRIKVISDDRFQFQSNVSVPSTGTSNRISGTPTYGIGTFILTVPQSAIYLIISTPITNSTAEVRDVYMWGMDTSDNLRVIGDVYTNCNSNATGGVKLASTYEPTFTNSITIGSTTITEQQLQSLLATL